MDRAPPFLAEIDLVQVHLEQLLLGIARVEEHGHDRLVDLAPQRALGREKEVLRKLLGERAAPLHDGGGAHVRPRGARDGDERDPMMIEEPVILDGHQPRDEHRRRLVQPDHHPVLVVAGIDAADERRVQPYDGNGTFARVDGSHDAGFESNLEPARRLVRIPESELAGLDDESVAGAAIAPRPARVVRPMVARALEIFLQRVGVQSGPRPQLDGARVHAGGQRPALAFELGPHADVEPGHVTGREDENEDRRPPHERAKEPPATPPRALPAFRGLRISGGRSALRRLRSPGPGAAPGAGRSCARLCHRRTLSPNGPARPSPTATPTSSAFESCSSI